MVRLPLYLVQIQKSFNLTFSASGPFAEKVGVKVTFIPR